MVNPFDKDIFFSIKRGWAIEIPDLNSKVALDLITHNSLGVLSSGNILLFESDTIFEVHQSLPPDKQIDFYICKHRRQTDLFVFRNCYRAETAVAGMIIFASEQSKQEFIYLTHKSIARFVGVWRETVNRALSKFKKQKLVAYNNRQGGNCCLGCHNSIALVTSSLGKTESFPISRPRAYCTTPLI